MTTADHATTADGRHQAKRERAAAFMLSLPRIPQPIERYPRPTTNPNRRHRRSNRKAAR
jgi:hypothetical protein